MHSAPVQPSPSSESPSPEVINVTRGRTAASSIAYSKKTESYSHKIKDYGTRITSKGDLIFKGTTVRKVSTKSSVTATHSIKSYSHKTKEYGEETQDKIDHKGDLIFKGTSVRKVRTKGSVTATNAKIDNIKAKGTISLTSTDSKNCVSKDKIKAIGCGILGTLKSKGNIQIQDCTSVTSISAKRSVTLQESTVTQTCFSKNIITAIGCPELGIMASKGNVKIQDCPSVASILSEGSLELRGSKVSGDVSSSSHTTIKESEINGTLTCFSSGLVTEKSQFSTIFFKPPVSPISISQTTKGTRTSRSDKIITTVVSNSPFSMPDGRFHIDSSSIEIDNHYYIQGKPLLIDGKTLGQWVQELSSGEMDKDSSSPVSRSTRPTIFSINEHHTSIQTKGNPDDVLIDEIPWQTWIRKKLKVQATETQIRPVETITLTNCTVDNIIFAGGNGEVILINSKVTGKITGGKIKE